MLPIAMPHLASASAQRIALALALLGVLPACDPVSCLGDEADCTVEAPCKALGPGATGGSTSVRVLGTGEVAASGIDALASPGDLVLENDRIVAVIDALDHPHYLAPTGGALLDLLPLDAAGDSADGVGQGDALNLVFQATGLLPGDAAHYTRVRTLEGEGFAAVQVNGHLDGHPEQTIATRYEVRPGEDGVRVRTEVVNGEAEPTVWTLVDGFYWGGNGQLPFTPRSGGGFAHPAIDIEAITDAYRATPLLATLPMRSPSLSYACVPCLRRNLSGFHDEDISAVGIEPRIVQPRDHLVHERFIAVTRASSVAPAVDLARGLRETLFGEAVTTLTGELAVEDGQPLGTEALATVRVIEPRAGGDITHTQATPDASGRFNVKLPVNRDYRVELLQFGIVVASRDVRIDEAPVSFSDLVPAPARLEITVGVDGAPADALLFIEPGNRDTRERVRADRFGQQKPCAPWLGPAGGTSPACNRVLVSGTTTIALPPGQYHVYATAGPFVTVARQRVDVLGGEVDSVSLELTSLPLRPSGSLAADFHVHGGASFDVSLPDRDRVRAMLAAQLDVIAATDHDVVHDYAEAIDALEASERMVVIPGLESTGHILFDFVPGQYVPKVIGHYNFWPLPHDHEAPYRGAPWDELAEPGLLFSRVADSGWPREHGVIQLNHPWGEADFGRDQGFGRAIGLDLRDDERLPESFDGSAQSLFRRTPAGADFSNADYHAQEVLNGADTAQNLAYRSFWFALLNRGLLRAGTANSDTHGLTGAPVGSPRTLVFADTQVGDFDIEAFDHAVRDGRMIGTSGPVIELELRQGDEVLRPSLDTIVPAADAQLWLRVTAAPWVPVEQIRVIINGRTVRVLEDELTHPDDPFGDSGTLRHEGTLSLGALLDDYAHGDGLAGDAWIVVEAGARLMAAADLGCDGIPDTGDNDGDGVIDRRDVDVDATADTPWVADPEIDGTCLDDVGPLRAPPAPTDLDDHSLPFHVVTGGSAPVAFTNPLVLDLDGGGFTGIVR